MTGNAIGTTLNFGYAGGYARMPDDVIASKPVKLAYDTVSLPAFGDAAVLNSDNTWSKWGANATATDFSGVFLAEIRQSLSYTTNSGSYLEKDPADVLIRGNCTVFCNYGTPSAGGNVYVRNVLNASIPAGVIGGFEATADGTNQTLLTNAVWTTGEVDTNNIAELSIKYRKNN